MELRLNEPMIDWVTLTRDGQLGNDGYAGNVLSAAGVNRQLLHEQGKEVYLKNGGGAYHGHMVQCPDGTISLYTHDVENRCMMTITSALAHRIHRHWLPAIQDNWTCTRVDVQITVPIERRFNALALAAMFDEKRSVSVISSTKTKRDGKTCYIGSKGSDRFGRVYEKVAGELLRLELKNGNGYAPPIALGLATTRYIDDVLWGVISNWVALLPNPGRDAIVKRFGVGDYRSKKLARIDHSPKREDWLKMAWLNVENCVVNGEAPSAWLVERMELLLGELYNGVSTPVDTLRSE